MKNKISALLCVLLTIKIFAFELRPMNDVRLCLYYEGSTPHSSLGDGSSNSENGGGGGGTSLSDEQSEELSDATESIDEEQAFFDSLLEDLNESIGEEVDKEKDPVTVDEINDYYLEDFGEDLGLEDSKKLLEDAAPKTEGDPVFIATGQYICKNIDGNFKWGKNIFNIERNYVSSEFPQGVFGKSWSSSFDTRIIYNIKENEDFLNELYLHKENVEKNSNILKKYEIFASAKYKESKELIEKYEKFISQYEEKIPKIKLNGKSQKTIYGSIAKYAEALSSKQLMYVSTGGKVLLFNWIEEDSCYRPADENLYSLMKIIYLENERLFAVKCINGFDMYYKENGQPFFFKDRYGLEIEFCYENEKIVSVKHKRMNRLSLSYNPEGLISKITNNVNGNTVYYNYEKGLLKEYIDEQNDSYKFEYDSAGDLTALVKPDGSRSVVSYTEVMDGSKRKVTGSHIDEDGNTETFEYDFSSRKIKYTDADKNITYYEFDENNNVTKQILPDYTVIEWFYDEKNNLVGKSDPYGKKYFSYDEFGNRVMESDADRINKWKYQKAYNLLSETCDKEGNVVSYLYSANGNLNSVIRNNFTVYSGTYYDWGGAKEINSIKGNNSYSYNENYELITDKDFSYEYDENNRLSSKINGNGGNYTYSYSKDGKTITCLTPQKLQITVVTNNRKDVEKIVMQDLLTNSVVLKKIIYDRRHNVKEIYEAKSDSVENAENKLILAKSYEYTPAGRIKSEIKWNYGKARINDGAGVKTEYVYEPTLKKYTVSMYFVDQNGVKKSDIVKTVYSYDYVQGKRIFREQTGAYCYEYESDRNENVLKEKQNEITKNVYEYYSDGRIKNEKNIFGGKIYYEYDLKTGYVSSVSDDLGNINRYEYNDEGDLSSVLEFDGYFTRYSSKEEKTYDLFETITSLGKKTYRFDKYGNVINYAITDNKDNFLVNRSVNFDYSNGRAELKDGDVTVQYELDSYGHIVYNPLSKESFEYNERGKVKSISKSKSKSILKTVLEYNCNNQISYIKKPGGNEINYYYDPSGNMLKITDSSGIVWEGSYNSEGMLIQEKGRNIPVREYEYDADFNRSSVKEGGEKIISYNYSDSYKKCETTDARNNVYTQWFDSYGNVIKIKNRESQIMSFSYKKNKTDITDYNGNVKTITNDRNFGKNLINYSSGNSDLLKFNAAGNLISFTNQNSDEKYFYNNRNLLEMQTVDGRNINFSYDDSGRNVSVTGDGIKKQFVYDNNGNLRRSVCNDIALSYIYDDDGNEITAYTENGMRFEREYDVSGRLISIVQKDSKGSVQFGEFYFYDDNGKISCITDNTGAVTLYEYDSRGRLVKAILPYEKKLEEESREELMECGEQMNPSFNLNALTVPQNMILPLKKIWSKLNIRQPLAVSGEKEWIESYKYDGNNNRIEKSTPLGTIHYSYDKENRLVCYGNRKPVTFEYDKNGNLLYKNSVYKTENYTYTEDNRIAEILNYDKRQKKYENINYTYDALGRRITKTKNGRQVMRTVYEGLSLNPLTQYRISGKSSLETAKDIPLSGETYYGGQRVFFYKDNILRGQMSGNSSYIFCNDIRGSVRTVNNTSGSLYSSVSYSSDGTPHMKKSDSFLTSLADELSSTGLDMLFVGKEYDVSASLYNFGFRDYAPSVAGFTSSDPICDGLNWYGYCAGDPVNFVDLWGLDILEADLTYSMTSECCKKIPLGFGKDLIGDVGCVLLEYTRIASSIAEFPIDPGFANEIAKQEELFTVGEDKQKNELTIDNGINLINFLLNLLGVNKEVSLDKSIEVEDGKADINDVEQALTEYEMSEEEYMAGARLITDNGQKDEMYKQYEHSVNVADDPIHSEGKDKKKNIFFNDTSKVRTKLNNDTRNNKIKRVDIFKINTKETKETKETSKNK